MELQESRRKLGLQLIENGAAQGAERLSRICRAQWRVEKLEAGAQAEECFAALCARASEDHFGSCFFASGGVFLVIFDRRSGLRVCTRFAGDFSDQLDIVENLEPAALGEVSNILVNALAEGLARSGRDVLMLSAPEPLIDGARELLQSALQRVKYPEKLALTCHVRLVCPALPAQAALVVLLDEDFLLRVCGV